MIDVTKVDFNTDADEVIITGIDLDSIWLYCDEPEEDTECKEVSYKFDTSLAGTRKYLYLVTKNNKKASQLPHMNQRLEALLGQTISLSKNFLVKDAQFLLRPGLRFGVFFFNEGARHPAKFLQNLLPRPQTPTMEGKALLFK